MDGLIVASFSESAPTRRGIQQLLPQAPCRFQISYADDDFPHGRSRSSAPVRIIAWFRLLHK